MSATPATDRQMSYLTKLVTATGTDLRSFLIDHGYCHATMTGTVAGRPSKDAASALISELAPERSTTRYARSGLTGRRLRYTSYRCTHEDYPCCGCGEDAR